MPVQPILLLGNPLLWTPSAPAEPGARETREIIADLGATLADFRERKGFGRAIAAPQIGKLLRVIVLNVGEAHVLLNPRITARSTDEMELWDDCFSFPELMARVRRSVEVTVSYVDEHGAARELVAKNQL